MKLLLATAALAACLATPLINAHTDAVSLDGLASDDSDMIYPRKVNDNEKVCLSREFRRGKYSISNNNDFVINAEDSHCTNVTKLLRGALYFNVDFNLTNKNFFITPNTEVKYSNHPVQLDQIKSIKSSMEFTINNDDNTDLIVYYEMVFPDPRFPLVITVWLEVVGEVSLNDYQKISDGVKVQDLEFDLYNRVGKNTFFILYVAKKVPRNLEIDLNLFILHHMNGDVSKSPLKLVSVALVTKAFHGLATATFTNYTVDVITKT